MPAAGDGSQRDGRRKAIADKRLIPRKKSEDCGLDPAPRSGHSAFGPDHGENRRKIG